MRFPIKVRSRNWLLVVISVYVASVAFAWSLGARDPASILLFLVFGHVLGDWVISSLLLYTKAFEWRGFNDR